MPSGIVTNREMPYGIGSDVLPGFSKLIEETGEMLQEIGKGMGLGSLNIPHWDGKGTIKDRLEEELADQQAAQIFVIQMNQLNGKRIQKRAFKKLAKFYRWHNNIQSGRDPNDDGDNN